MKNRKPPQPVSERARALLKTELRSLQSQMSPHFLLPTIDNVRTLAETGSDKTSSALQLLSGILSYQLYQCLDQVPLYKEMEAIGSYIALLQLRYETPLDIRIENEVRDVTMPIEPMLLIPLLENAFKYSGIGGRPEAFIHIHLREEAGLLFGRFTHSRVAPAADGRSVGIGLRGIRERLELLQPYRPEENLVILESPEVFEVFIKIAVFKDL
jgi:two-component system, LytTR family, sensor kinase